MNIPVHLAELMEGWSKKDAEAAYKAWKTQGGTDDGAEGFDSFLAERYARKFPPYDRPAQ